MRRIVKIVGVAKMIASAICYVVTGIVAPWVAARVGTLPIGRAFMRTRLLFVFLLWIAAPAAATISPADEDEYDRLRIAEELAYACSGASYFEQVWMARIAENKRPGSRAEKYENRSRTGGLGSWIDPATRQENRQFWRQRAEQLGCEGGKPSLDNARSLAFVEAGAVALLALNADQQDASMPGARKLTAEEKTLIQLLTGSIQQTFGQQVNQFQNAAQSRAQAIFAEFASSPLTWPTLQNTQIDTLFDAIGLELAAQSAGYTPRIERLDDATVLPVLRPKAGSGAALTVLGGPAQIPVSLRLPAGSVARTRVFVALDESKRLWTVIYGAQSDRVAAGRVTGAIIGWHTPSYGEGVNADKAGCPWALCVIHTPDQVEAMAAQKTDGSLYSVVTGLDSYGTGSDKRSDRVIFGTDKLRSALARVR